MTGQVVNGEAALSEGMVVLHSVSPDLAGEVDSMRVGEEGRFRFALPRVLDGDNRTQVYFASVRHQGVLYFGEAIARTRQLDSLYTIEVFDSEVAPEGGFPLPLAVRNVVMEQKDGVWLATDLLQIQNDRERTIVASDGGVVWSHELPEAAFDVVVGPGDLPAGAVDFVDGRVVVRAPIPPGERLLLIRYRVEELPFEIPVAAPTGVMELLVKESAPPVNAPPLQAVSAVSIDESNYRRYTGQSLSAGVPILVEEAEVLVAFPVGWMAVLFAFLLTGAGLFVYYRPVAVAGPVVLEAPGAYAPRREPYAVRASVIVEIARLDECVSALAEDAAAERDALLVQRAELMDRLRARS